MQPIDQCRPGTCSCAKTNAGLQLHHASIELNVVKTLIVCKNACAGNSTCVGEKLFWTWYWLTNAPCCCVVTEAFVAFCVIPSNCKNVKNVELHPSLAVSFWGICLLVSAFILLCWLELARIYFSIVVSHKNGASKSLTVYFTGKML